MLIAKKIIAVVVIAALGLIGFGLLPKPLANRLTKALMILFFVGFALRVGAYLLQGG